MGGIGRGELGERRNWVLSEKKKKYEVEKRKGRGKGNECAQPAYQGKERTARPCRVRGTRKRKGGD